MRGTGKTNVTEVAKSGTSQDRGPASLWSGGLQPRAAYA
jgi:hypothetical protein